MCFYLLVIGIGLRLRWLRSTIVDQVNGAVHALRFLAVVSCITQIHTIRLQDLFSWASLTHSSSCFILSSYGRYQLPFIHPRCQIRMLFNARCNRGLWPTVTPSRRLDWIHRYHQWLCTTLCASASRLYRTIIFAYDAIPYSLARRDSTAHILRGGSRHMQVLSLQDHSLSFFWWLAMVMGVLVATVFLPRPSNLGWSIPWSNVGLIISVIRNHPWISEL